MVDLLNKPEAPVARGRLANTLGGPGMSAEQELRS